MPDPDKTIPRVPPSSEEKRLGARMTIIALLASALIFSPTAWLLSTPSIPVAAGLAGSLAYVAITSGLLALITQLRWPGAIVIRSEIEIAASAEKIWDTLRFEPEKPYYKPIVLKIERIAEVEEAYRLHYFSDRPCSSCGYYRHPDSAGYYVEALIIESLEPNRLRMRCRISDIVVRARWTAMDFEDEQFDIVPVRHGVCRVSERSRIVRPALMLAVILKLGDPMGQNLSNLKAYLECGTDETIWGTVPARIAAVSQATKFCACSNGIEIEIADFTQSDSGPR
jgi:hypothetical protein